MQKIIVGVDGSESAGRAVDWAMAHANPDDVVVLVHTWSIPSMSGYEVPASSLEDFRAAARNLMADIVARITPSSETPSSETPTVETDVRSGHAGLRLTELSADADMVVVGSRGYGGFRGMLLGSVSSYLVHHANCPVVVIRGEGPSGNRESDSA